MMVLVTERLDYLMGPQGNYYLYHIWVTIDELPPDAIHMGEEYGYTHYTHVDGDGRTIRYRVSVDNTGGILR